MSALEKEIEEKVEEVLHTKTVEKATAIMRSKHGTAIVAAISFFESALPVPLITDPFLIAAIMLDRARVVRLVIVTTLASAIGGVAAYFMALFFFDIVSHWMSPMVLQEFNELINNSQYSTTVLTLLGAVTPIPYTTVAWVVAVIQGNLLVFFLASIVGRGFRYALVGYSTYRFGQLAMTYAKRYIGIASVFVVFLATVYFWYKLNM